MSIFRPLPHPAPPDTLPALPSALLDFMRAVAPAKSALPAPQPPVKAQPAQQPPSLPPPLATGADCVQNLAELRIRHWIMQREAEQRRLPGSRVPPPSH